MENPSRPTWNDLHPVLPRPITQDQALSHHNTKQAIGALPRNILGIAILRALRMRLPNPPRQARPLTPAMLEESARQIQKMREELAAQRAQDDGPDIVDTTQGAVEELRGSVTRSEAQSTFEAQMRAAQLRKSLNS